MVYYKYMMGLQVNPIRKLKYSRRGRFEMKEKTFKDLGLDEGDKYLKKISSEFDLGELENLLDDRDDEEELKKKIKDIKDKI